MENRIIKIPKPIIDSAEFETMTSFKERYEKLIEPNIIIKAGKKL